MSHNPGYDLPLRDSERLGVLLTSLEPRLKAVALRFTRDPDSASDIVQNAFERVVRHGDRFRGESLVSTWLHRIVTNEALMWLRAERRRARLGESARSVQSEHAMDAAGPSIDPALGPAELLIQRERSARLRNEVARLPQEERDVVLCCSLAGQSYAQYGRRTGRHPAAVKSRAFRARRRLSALLIDS